MQLATAELVDEADTVSRTQLRMAKATRFDAIHGRRKKDAYGCEDELNITIGYHMKDKLGWIRQGLQYIVVILTFSTTTTLVWADRIYTHSEDFLQGTLSHTIANPPDRLQMADTSGEVSSFWRVTYDSGYANNAWGLVSWNSDEPEDSRLDVILATSEDGIQFSDPQQVSVGPAGVPLGRYLRIQVNFIRATNGASPQLFDVKVTHQPKPGKCDVDHDGDIDRLDITAIYADRNQPATGPDDPRDADSNGVINILDGRRCTGLCTQARCPEIAPNQPPIADAGIDQTAAVGDVIHLDGLGSSDPEGDELSYRWQWVAIPAGSAAVLQAAQSSTPHFTADQSGLYLVELIVNDGRVDSIADTVRIDVTGPVNQSPVITSAPIITGRANTLYEYDVEAHDPEGDVLSYALTMAPVGMTIDSATGIIRWLPTTAQQGDHDVVVTVEDGHGGFDQQSFVIQVVGVSNTPPQIISTPVLTVQAGQLYRYDVEAVDAESLSLSYTLTAAPNTMTIDSTSGLITWAPDVSQSGDYAVTVEVSDGQLTDTQSFTLQVEATNRAPVITSTAVTTGVEQDLYQYRVTATDPDGDVLSFVLTTAPAGMTISATGTISWTPSFNQSGQHSVTVIVSDGQLSDSQAFIVLVADTNRAPNITSTPVTTGTENTPYRYPIVASDPDGDALTYELTQAPNGMQIDSQGVTQWTPSYEQAGDYSIIITVTDTQGASDQQAFTLTIADVNRPPIINPIPPATLTVGDVYQQPVLAQDPDGDALTFDLAAAPTSMTIQAITGDLHWSTQPGDEGDYTFNVIVSDGRGGSATATVELTVVPPANRPPIAEAGPHQTVTLGAVV